jgi:hypothetical protein
MIERQAITLNENANYYQSTTTNTIPMMQRRRNQSPRRVNWQIAVQEQVHVDETPASVG